MKNIKKLEKSTAVLELDLTNLEDYLGEEGIYKNSPYSTYVLHLDYGDDTYKVSINYDKEMFAIEEFEGKDYIMVEFDAHQDSAIVEAIKYKEI